MDNVTIRLRKMMKNPLLSRKQFVIELIHPGKASISKADLQKELAKSLKVADPQCIFLFGFKLAFGGGKSTGFGLVYNDKESALKFEPKYRLVRNGIIEAKETSKKQKTEKKNRDKKVRGTGVRTAKRKAKRAAA